MTVASVLVCHYLKHGMECGMGDTAVLLAVGFVAWILFIGLMVIGEVEKRLDRDERRSA